MLRHGRSIYYGPQNTPWIQQRLQYFSTATTASFFRSGNTAVTYKSSHFHSKITSTDVLHRNAWWKTGGLEIIKLKLTQHLVYGEKWKLEWELIFLCWGRWQSRITGDAVQQCSMNCATCGSRYKQIIWNLLLLPLVPPGKSVTTAGIALASKVLARSTNILPFTAESLWSTSCIFMHCKNSNKIYSHDQATVIVHLARNAQCKAALTYTKKEAIISYSFSCEENCVRIIACTLKS